MSIMGIMDRSGHTEVHWDAADETSIRVARETFNRMTSEGYRAFHISPKGGQGQPMTEFDVGAEFLILIPHLQGG